MSIDDQFELCIDKSIGTFVFTVREKRSNGICSNDFRFSYELDGIEQTEKYPPSFRVTLETSLSKKPPSNEQEFLNQQIQQTFQRPQTLFKDENDFRQTIDEYGKENHQHFPFLSNKKQKQNEKYFS